MAGENNKNSNRGSSVPANEDFNRSLPITNTTTSMPNVKPPKEPPSNSGNDTANQNSSDD